MRPAFVGGGGSVPSVLRGVMVVGCAVVVGCTDGPELGADGKVVGPDAAIESAGAPLGAAMSVLGEGVALGSIRSYAGEGEPLLGWVRQGRFNVRAGRVAILDYLHPNVKVFDDRLRLDFVAAVGDRRFPNDHGIADLVLTDDGTAVVVTESGWVLGLREGEALDLGTVGRSAPGPGRLRLAECGTGWAVVSEAAGAALPVPLAESPTPGFPGAGPARRPTVSVATDPATLVEVPLSRTDPIRVGAAPTHDGDCEVTRPSRLETDGRAIRLPDDARLDGLVVFPDPSGGGVVTLDGPGPWFATGLLEAQETGP